jgi:hypothetical protein
LRDAIELEWAGKPTVAVVVDALVGSAEQMKRVSQMPDYPYAVTPYPIGSLTREELRTRAPKIIDDALRLFTERTRIGPREKEDL